MLAAPDLCKIFFDAMDDAVLVVDGATHRVIEANAEAVACTAYPHEELKGLSVDRLFRAAPPDRLFNLLSGPPSLGPWARALEVLTKGGEAVNVRVSLSRRRSRDSDFIFIVMQRLPSHRLTVARSPELGSRSHDEREVPGLLGHSDCIRHICRLIGSIARSDVTVLIQGESGTGKEVVASAIHSCSQRMKGPFATINCGALPDTLLESELFGHVKGAFTGAIRDRSGRFKLADGGTLLLDEIGSMSLSGQVKLLRVLQQRTFEPVGSSLATAVNVRVIASTNVDLERAVEEGSFRKDLYYRLNVFPIYLPPLRDRKEDVPLLVEHFLEKFNSQLGKRVREVGPDALAAVMQHDWPGNVRELENAIEHALIVEESSVLGIESLPPSLRHLRAEACEEEPTRALGLRDRMRVLEKQIIVDSLVRSNWVKKRAATMLRIDARNMPYFMRKHRLGDGARGR